MLTLKSQHVKRKMNDVRQTIQKINADYEIQKRVTDKSVADAEALCPRVDTKRLNALYDSRALARNNSFGVEE